MTVIKKISSTEKRQNTAKKKFTVLAFAKKIFAPILIFTIIVPQTLIPLTVLAKVTPLTNPTLTQSCGLDLVLVLDNSVSIDETELGEMRIAFDNFVDILAGTPTEFAVVKFNTNATIQEGFTANANTAKDAIKCGRNKRWCY